MKGLEMMYRRTRTECIHCLKMVDAWVDTNGVLYSINHNCRAGQEKTQGVKNVSRSRRKR